VDWFQGDRTGGEGASYEKTLETFEKMGVKARVLNQDMLTVNWKVLFPDCNVNLVFYDACHTYNNQTECLRNVHQVLAPHARVVVHDAKFPEVRESINRLCAEGLYRESVFVDVWEGLAILQKNPN